MTSNGSSYSSTNTRLCRQFYQEWVIGRNTPLKNMLPSLEYRLRSPTSADNNQVEFEILPERVKHSVATRLESIDMPKQQTVKSSQAL